MILIKHLMVFVPFFLLGSLTAAATSSLPGEVSLYIDEAQLDYSIDRSRTGTRFVGDFMSVSYSVGKSRNRVFVSREMVCFISSIHRKDPSTLFPFGVKMSANLRFSNRECLWRFHTNVLHLTAGL